MTYSDLGTSNLKRYFDRTAYGFFYRYSIEGEYDTEYIPQLATELKNLVLDDGKTLLDEYAFLTIPVRMKVYACGWENGVMELRVRLPLADTDDVLAKRMDELDSAVKEMGFEVI